MPRKVSRRETRIEAAPASAILATLRDEGFIRADALLGGLAKLVAAATDPNRSMWTELLDRAYGMHTVRQRLAGRAENLRRDLSDLSLWNPAGMHALSLIHISEPTRPY